MEKQKELLENVETKVGEVAEKNDISSSQKRTGDDDQTDSSNKRQKE